MDYTQSHHEPIASLETPRGGGILAWLERRLTGLHREQGGAIGILCLAATLIVFMVGLIVYDTGKVTREKLDAQMAADTAAYSQAAVKARSMNMAAFANVGKRTVSGIRNMYYWQYPIFLSWWSGQCSRCCCGFFCGCWTECFNCIGNIGVVIAELPDWLAFFINRFGGSDPITQHLTSLDDFQQGLKDFTPYWAHAEALLRGGTNKGNFIGTFPLPTNSTASSGASDTTLGQLPYEKADGFFGPMESCLTPTLVFNVMTLGTMLEWQRDFEVLKKQSTSKPLIAREGPRERVRIYVSYLGCFFQTFGADAEPSRPVFLVAPGDTGENLMSRSNFIFSYRSAPELSQNLRQNYNFLRPDYKDSMMFKPDGGVWSMARGEIHFPESATPFNLGGFMHNHGLWMFHPGWTSKLRPFALPGEKSPVKPSDMWKDAEKGMLQQGIIFGSDAGSLIKDQLYMKKVMRGFDGTIENKDVIDGFSK